MLAGGSWVDLGVGCDPGVSADNRERLSALRFREARYFSPVGADLVRDSRNHRRDSRMRSAPTPPHPRHSL
ncbi:hypothetical protein PCLA_02r0688 [Pseudomonas citronellolis]|nr:hypothetical protein PCLA_02r0688 [Pseudomonas citronellolis]